MPFRTHDTTVFLDAHCPIEEAEALYETVRDMSSPIFDLTEASHLHTAIVQVIMASGGTVRGLPPDPVLAACFRDRTTR